MRHSWFLTIAVCILARTAKTSRCDWPGLLGPNRNSIASENSSLPKSFPKSLVPLWEIPAGQGYAGASIQSGLVCMYDRTGEDDRVRLVELGTGKVLWTSSFPAAYQGGIDSDKGPRCVPGFLADRILVYSASGYLVCLSIADGKILWKRNLKQDYQGADGYFGAGSTPVLFGEKAIVNVGGKLGGIVCVDTQTGDTVWKATNADASYASPILVQANSSVSVVVPTRLTTYCLDVEKGNIIWEIPFGMRGPTVNAATPLRTKDDQLFLTASYGIGNVTIDRASTPSPVVEKGDLLSSQYASPVYVNGRIYGSDGREDHSNGAYKCLTGDGRKILWEKSSMPIVHTIVVENRLVLVGIDGRIWVLDSQSDSFSPVWETELPKDNYKALPAFDGQILILRSRNRWYAWSFKN